MGGGGGRRRRRVAGAAGRGGVGPGADYEDPYGDWARLREAGDAGCVLVRPDNYVCYRSAGLPTDPGAALLGAMRAVPAL